MKPKETQGNQKTKETQMASQIKEWLLRPAAQDEGEPDNAEWFAPGPKRFVSTAEISRFAEVEYDKWKRVGTGTYTCTYEAELRSWVRQTSEEEIDALLSACPTGLDAMGATYPAFDFTPWQRLFLALYVDLPFPVHSRIMITTSEVVNLVGTNGRGRKIPFFAEYTLAKGSFPDVGIIDLPTASSKTALTCCIAYMAMLPGRFERLASDDALRARNRPMEGSLSPKVARLCVVAAAANTHSHFVSTLTRLISRWKREGPAGMEYHLWTKLGTHLWERALSLSETGMIFWVVPMAKLNEVLRGMPDVRFAVQIMDEYTVDTPRERSVTCKATPYKHLLAQATPRALEEATEGNRSWLKELLGGPLVAPRRIGRLIRGHAFSDAQLGCRQLCQMDCMTVSAWRTPIRESLFPLLPTGMEVHHVPCRRMTISSHLLNTSSDVLPASFVNVLCAMVMSRGYALSDDVSAMRDKLNAKRHTSIDEVIGHLKQVRPSREYHAPSLKTEMERIVARMEEFRMQCPICFTEPGQSAYRVYGCCGYCVCDECYHITEQHRSTCPFCRTDVPNFVDASSVPTAPAPPASTAFLDTSPNNSVRENLLVCLNSVVAWNFKRSLVLVEAPNLASGFDDMIRMLTQHTSSRIFDVTKLLRGKGTEFAEVKREYDRLDTPHMSLVCIGGFDALVYGSDLPTTDSILVVGDVPNSLITQAVGRAFRPLIGRPAHSVTTIRIAARSQ